MHTAGNWFWIVTVRKDPSCVSASSAWLFSTLTMIAGWSGYGISRKNVSLDNNVKIKSTSQNLIQKLLSSNRSLDLKCIPFYPLPAWWTPVTNRRRRLSGSLTWRWPTPGLWAFPALSGVSSLGSACSIPKSSSHAVRNAQVVTHRFDELWLISCGV